MKGIDVNHINPFLQSTMSVVESVTQMKLGVGRPEKTDLHLTGSNYAIQVGVVGAMQGQVVLVMNESNAKEIASRMMFGMPIETIDEMAASALNELGNMVMGNTATLFSAQGILIDITPPLSMYGNDIKLNSDIEGLKVPMLFDGKECIGLYICVNNKEE